jgi:hypothetical protein
MGALALGYLGRRSTILNKAGDGVSRTKSAMKSIIKYEIYEITECKGYDHATGKSVPQKNAKMCVVSTQDKNDPNYVFGQVSGGSHQELKTINPNVYNTWFVGAIITQEMEVTPVQ